MDKLQAMRTLVAVVESGSFVRATTSTGQSKPAVSRQIAELERQLGVRLLQRTTRKLSLTDEGRSYYWRCKEVLAAIQTADEEARTHAQQAHGRLRISAPQDFGVLHLAPLWPRFMSLHPHVSLDVVLSDRTVDLIEEGYDLAVRIGSLPNSSLVARPLATTRMVLCASPKYLATSGSPTRPEDLGACQAISYSYLSDGQEWHFRHASQPPVAVHIASRFQANSGATCRVLALCDQGIILQPDFLIHDDLRTGRLVELMPQWQAQSLTVHALYPTRTLLPMKVQLLRDFLVDALRIPPWQKPEIPDTDPRNS